MGTAKRERQKANRQARLEQMYHIERRKKATNTGLKVGGAIVGLVAVAVLLALTVGKSDDKSSTAATTIPSANPTAVSVAPGATITGDTPCPKADGSSERTTSFAKAPPMCIDPAKTYTATLETNKGTYSATLDPKTAPLAVNNFVTLARYGFYNGVACHRIVKQFVVQCGDPTGTGGGGPGYTFADELPKSADAYQPGTLAMANSGPNTNGSQFFVVLAPGKLTANYTIFGKVTDGLDTTVKAMEAAGSTDEAGATTEPISITKVTINES